MEAEDAELADADEDTEEARVRKEKVERRGGFVFDVLLTVGQVPTRQ